MIQSNRRNGGRNKKETTHSKSWLHNPVNSIIFMCYPLSLDRGGGEDRVQNQESQTTTTTRKKEKLYQEDTTGNRCRCSHSS
jgi:hypothetical protein